MCVCERERERGRNGPRMKEKSTETLITRRLTPGFVFRVALESICVFSSTGFAVDGESEISAIIDPGFAANSNSRGRREKYTKEYKIGYILRKQPNKHLAVLAQLVERVAFNHVVVGSIPTDGAYRYMT